MVSGTMRGHLSLRSGQFWFCAVFGVFCVILLWFCTKIKVFCAIFTSFCAIFQRVCAIIHFLETYTPQNR